MDFNVALNSVVSRLRHALGGWAESPSSSRTVTAYSRRRPRLAIIVNAVNVQYIH